MTFITKLLISAGIGPFLRKHPRLLALVMKARFSIWNLRAKMSLIRPDYEIDVNEVHWVHPQQIEHAVILDNYDERTKYSQRGAIAGGDWDKKTARFEDRPFTALLLTGLEERFSRSMQWKETTFYGRALEMVSGDGDFKHIYARDQAALDERCRKIDGLFAEIRDHGYRAQSEIVHEYGDPYAGADEVTVRIDRHGELLFEDGQHRLAIAKFLHLDRIPVKITVRHAEWYKFRKQVLAYARDQKILGARLYHPITHTDFAGIPSVYGDERFDIIRNHLPLPNGDILDIGAHWGYFCHRFEELGFTCFAVENDPANVYFLQKLKRAEKRHFEVIDSSIFEYRAKTKFDVVFALNIFHHFVRSEDTYNELRRLLRRLQTTYLFFQPALPDPPSIKAYRRFDCDEFVSFIMANSDLNKAARIGETSDGRPLYRLERV